MNPFTCAMSRALRVDDEGSLRAAGTEDSSVVFRGGEGIPGYWLGIEYDTLKGDDVLESVSILDAGSEDVICCGDSAASVLVNGEGFASLTNVAFQNAMGHASLVAQGERLNCTSVEGNRARFKFLTNQGS